MPSIIAHGNGWRAVVRKVGYKTQTKCFERKGDAQKWARNIETEMDSLRFQRPAKGTGAELVVRFRDEVAPKRKGGKWEKVRCDKFLREIHFLKKPVANITAHDVLTWRDETIERTSEATARREMSLLSGIFTHAIKEWLVPLRANPCSLVKWPESSPHRYRRPSPDELSRLLAHFKFNIKLPPYEGRGGGVSSVAWLILIGIETAMRASELCGMRWENVDFKTRTIFVPDSKNGKSRSVPMTEYAETLLLALYNGPRFKLRYEGKVFRTTPGNLDAEFRAACKKLGIENLHFHDTRHEGITRFAAHFGILDLAKVVGHADPKTLMIYYNPTAEEMTGRLRTSEKKAAEQAAAAAAEQASRKAKKKAAKSEAQASESVDDLVEKLKAALAAQVTGAK